MSLFTDILLFLFSWTLIPISLSIASEDSALSSTQKKAVLQISQTDGFKLSSKGANTIGLKSKVINSAPDFLIPDTALVHSLDKLAIYRLRNGWYKLVPIVIIKKLSNSELMVHSLEINTQVDQVVIQGTGLLRATEMEAFGGGDD